jgi:hypothetical protein
LAATLAVLGAVALGSWVIWTNPGSAPAPSGKPALTVKERNWIWRPTQEDLKWAEGVEGGALYVQGPIVDEATGEPITGRVFINGEFVAETREVAVLMWATAERPNGRRSRLLRRQFFLRVEASGYHAWDLRFRFEHEGLGEMKGPIRLKPEG